MLKFSILTAPLYIPLEKEIRKKGSPLVAGCLKFIVVSSWQWGRTLPLSLNSKP